MNDNDLITIIIPVYNVEKYIEKNIQSVISQTYNKLEIILVDDGSKDNSGKICDEYAKTDNRISVIHKENGGLSDARNKGLEISTGNWIFFLDSDDFLPKFSIETLYNLAINNNADISVGTFYDYYNSDFNIDYEIFDKDLDITVNVYKDEQGLETMLYNSKITNAACNKLYKKELFEDITFPKGKLYEDLGTTYKLFYNAKRVTLTNQHTYCYFRDRLDSIMNKTYNSNRMQGLKYAEEILEFTNNKIPAIKKSAISRLYMECIFILIEMPKDKEFNEDRKKINYYLRKYRGQIILDKKMPIKQKMLAMSSMFGKKVLMLVWNLKEKMKRTI